MKPAFSVIFFTTLSGLGYGLAFWLALDMASGGAAAGSAWHGGVGMTLALGLIIAGLLSSTLHLGHPERAWRALTQWRSSWLSREGVAACLSLPPLGLVWLAWVTGAEGAIWAVLALLGAALAAATVYCTGMIYQSLKPVADWTSPLTTPVYILYAAVTGGFAAAMIDAWFGQAQDWRLGLVIVLTGLLAVAKAFYWRRAAATPGLTPEAATGLGRIGTVRQLEAPHVTQNFITREMGFQVARQHAGRLRTIAGFLGFGAPAGLGLAALTGPGAGAVWLTIACLAALLGAIAERWLFFAEARHAVTAFYGRRD